MRSDQNNLVKTSFNKTRQLTAENIQSTFCAWISVDNPEYVHLGIIVFLRAHKCCKRRIALQALQFLECRQVEDVETAACRYYQDGLLNLEEHNVFIESKASEYF